MNTKKLNTSFIDNYLGLIENLSVETKQDLIEKIKKTLKISSANKKSSITDSFGAWKSKKSADDIITELRKSRIRV
ncbi:MAG: hypothetical protein ACPGTO_00490 [Polaribacter sp.]